MNGSSALMTLWPSPSLAWILCYFVVLYSPLSILKMRSEIREGERIGSDDTVPLEGRVSLDSKEICLVQPACFRSWINGPVRCDGEVFSRQ